MTKLQINYKIKKFDPLSITDDLKADLMSIEKDCFKPSIRETWKSKKEIIKNCEIVLFVWLDEWTIIGESYVETKLKEEGEDLGHPDYIHLKKIFSKMKKENGVYFYSFAVLPVYQGLGIGKKLLLTMIKECKKKGFSCIYSHSNAGQSAHLFEKVGGKFITKRENWFDTGNTHNLYRIDLT